jgi:hypothetical protein
VEVINMGTFQQAGSFLETIERVVEQEEHDESGPSDECASPGTITLFG